MTFKLFFFSLLTMTLTLSCSSSQTASSGDGGSDASPRSDAPLDGTGRDGSIRDGAPVDASALVDKFCSVTATFICKSLELCDPDEYAFTSLSACEAAWEGVCLPSYAGYARYLGVAYVETLLACYEAQAALGPECALSPGVTAADVENAAKACAAADDIGTLGNGAKCFASVQCGHDLYCVVPDGGVCGGTCEPAHGMGESCGNDVLCDSTLYCDPEAQVCRLAAVGQPCGTATQSEGECGAAPGETFFCYANKCQAWQEKGQACSAEKPCDAYNFLYCSTAGVCDTATIGAGSACNGSCLGNYYCDSSNQCATPLGSGAPCTAGVEKMCDITQGLACNGTTCQLAYATSGQPCGGGTQCWKGTCVPSNDGGVHETCEAFLQPGDTCVNTGGEPQCEILYECSGGKCVLDNEPADAGIPACDRDAF
jgi:hypothetical protein